MNLNELIKNNKLEDIKFIIKHKTFDLSDLLYGFKSTYSQMKIPYDIIEYFVNEFDIHSDIVLYSIRYKQVDVINLLLSKNNFHLSDYIMTEIVNLNDSNILELFIFHEKFQDFLNPEYLINISVTNELLNSFHSLLKLDIDLTLNQNSIIHKALFIKNTEIIKTLLKNKNIEKSLKSNQKELYNKIKLFLSKDKVKEF